MQWLFWWQALLCISMFDLTPASWDWLVVGDACLVFSLVVTVGDLIGSFYYDSWRYCDLAV